MAKIALHDATVSQTTASGHITYRSYDYQYTGGGGSDGNGGYYPTYPVYEWVNHTTSATVNGTAKSTVSNVLIQGKPPILQGDKTNENDTYTLPSGGVYVSGQHTGAQGSVTGGNSRNVYVNGKLVSLSGSTVNTHAGGSSTINGGISSTVDIG